MDGNQRGPGRELVLQREERKLLRLLQDANLGVGDTVRWGGRVPHRPEIVQAARDGAGSRVLPMSSEGMGVNWCYNERKGGCCVYCAVRCKLGVGDTVRWAAQGWWEGECHIGPRVCKRHGTGLGHACYRCPVRVWVDWCCRECVVAASKMIQT